MNDGLTLQQDALLRRPFQPAEHGFVNGRPYLLKDAIRRRLSQVDPAWSISPPQLVALTDDAVILTAGLVIAGVARYDVGTGLVQRFKPDGRELPPYELARSTARAFKTAASDLLPRCAVQFGLGDYLKAVPRSVADPRSLRDWLLSLAKPAEPPATVPRGQSSAPARPAVQP